MHALLQCWFDSGLCLFVFLIHFLSKKKKINLENVTVWGFVWFFAMTITKGSFFSSYFHWCDFRKNVLYSFIPCIFSFFFFFWTFLFFLEAVSFVGPWTVHKGEELLPYPTSRRCWKQGLKKRTDIKEARRDLIMGTATSLGNVLSDNSQSSTEKTKTNKKKKRFTKLCLRLVFFSYLTREQSRRTL